METAKFQKTWRRCPGGNAGFEFMGEFHCFAKPGGLAGLSDMSDRKQFLIGSFLGLFGFITAKKAYEIYRTATMEAKRTHRW